LKPFLNSTEFIVNGLDFILNLLLLGHQKAALEFPEFKDQPNKKPDPNK